MTENFFRARLEQMIDLKHPLVVLVNRMPLGQIGATLAPSFMHKDREGEVIGVCDRCGTTLWFAGVGISAAGRLRLSIRLMASLLYLKHDYKLSDDDAVDRWAENVVWQYFCGQTYCEPT